MTTAHPAYQPFVEDYHSDDSDGNGAVLSSNFPRKASPQANVSSKRSKDLNEKPPVQDTFPADLISDSGYSSYTAASKTSADSAQSQRSPPVAAAPAASHSHSHSQNQNQNQNQNQDLSQSLSQSQSQSLSHQNQNQSQSPAPNQRRPTGTERKQTSNESSPRRQTLSRTPSTSSKRPAAGPRRLTVTRQEDVNNDCTDPNCESCGPNARTRRTRTERTEAIPATASAREFTRYPPSDQVSQHSDPNPYFTQTSPTYTREYMQGPAVIKPSSTRRRSSTVRRRPQSFAGEPGSNYWVPGMPGYPSPPQEHGPPLSMSAFQNMHYGQMPPYMAAGGGPSQPGFFSGSTHQTSPPYDQPRPNMSARNPSGYGQRNFPPPIVTDDRVDNGKYSARYQQQQQPPTPSDYPQRNTRQPRLIQKPFDNDGSSSFSSGGEEEEEEEEEPVYSARPSRPQTRAIMPPPDLPEPKRAQSKKRRPTFSQAASTPVLETHERRRQSIVVDRPREKERQRDPITRVSTAPPRRPSISRPPPPQRDVVSEYHNPAARVLVNNSRSNRRQLYQGNPRDHEKEYHQSAQERLDEIVKAQERRQKRSSRNYPEGRHMPGEYREDNEEEEEEKPRLALVSRPRKKTDAELRKGKERISETKNKRAENAAEEYIKATRGSRDPVADTIIKSAKRASRVLPVYSESGSSNSNGSGKQSISQRTNMTSNGNNEIRLRVDASAPLALSFNGDMEGRTLQLLPAENGMTDVVIGNRENTYQNERGTIVTSSRRSVHGNQMRRDAGDIISERSIRGGRTRRERDDFRDGRIEQDNPRAHVLRRIQNTTYHNNR